MSSNSSKGHQSPRSPQRSTKGIQGDLNSSKRYQRRENPVVVKSSSNGHQMVLTESSKVPKNSPQMFHKKSSKVPERFFSVLRSSCPQVFKKSSKSPQSPQKVKKMHERNPRSSGLRFSNDPQNVLYFLKSAIKSLEALIGPQKVFKSTPQSPQKVINVVKILWSSKVPQMFIKWSSKSPQKSLNTVLKMSTKSQQKVLKSSSTFWDTQVLRSSKSHRKRPQSPQKIRKMHKKVPNVLRPQVLKRYSNRPQSPQKFINVLNSSVGIQVRENPQCPEKSFNSSKASGPQSVHKK